MSDIPPEEESKLRELLVQKLLEDDGSIEIGGDLSEEKKAKQKQELLEKLVQGDGKLLRGGSKIKIGSSKEGIEKFLKRKGGNKDTVDCKTALSADARRIHEANVIRIIKLIDKTEKNAVEDDIKLSETEIAIAFPDNNEWDFKLGDKVLVNLSLKQFRCMQKQALAWKKQLSNVRGQCGFITDMKSKYESCVQVYFPNVYASSSIYAGTLSKADENFHDVASRWKVGDFVKTKKSKELVEKFQNRLPDLPDKHIGKTGRVIAVTSAGIFVTYNGRTSYAVNSVLLLASDDSTPIEPVEKICHPKGFKVGDKVRVLKDIKKLIKNQKGNGGWNWKMSSLVGKTVTITYINMDASLNVALKHIRSWRINYESVYKEEHEGLSNFPEDLQYMPGDKACFRLAENITIQLAEAKVLESCLDFLKQPAIVDGIDKHFDVAVRFNNDKKHVVKASSLRKATTWEAKKYDDIEAKRMCLKTGDIVQIDVGPPRYVKNILEKIKAKMATSDALTQSAELLGFLNEDHAVIRYKDGRRIQINKKYLVPREKYVPVTPRKVDFEVVCQLMNMLQSSVDAIHFELSEDPQDSGIDLYSVISGVPPTVCFRIASALATPSMIFKRLSELTKWKIQSLDENEALVNPNMGRDQEINLVLLSFTEDPSIPKINDIEELTNPTTSNDVKRMRTENKSIHKDRGNASLKAEPFLDSLAEGPMDDQQPPQINGWGDFRYLTFHTTGGTLFFHYIPHYNVPSTVQAGGENPQTVERRVSNNFTIHGNVSHLTSHKQ